MRTDSDRARGGLPAGRRRALKHSLLGKLLLVSLTAVGLAALLAGVGAMIMADLVIVRGDMMVAEHYQQFRAQMNWFLLAVVLLSFALTGGAVWVLSRQMVQPLRRIGAVAEAVSRGDYSPRVGPTGPDELGDLARSIDRMTASLARVEQLRRDLVANVAHELRTPLTALHGLICALRDGLVEPNRQSMEQLDEEVQRLVRLVEALHQLSLSDAAPLRLKREALDLGALVREVGEGMQPLFEQRLQRLEVAVDAAPLPVAADRDGLVQILVNLLDNAAKYSPEGGRVRIAAGARSDGGMIVEVENGGPGIAPEDLPHIFERFYRGEKSRARESGGAGIGLAIARNLAEAHGGRLTAASGSGSTCFTLSLPGVETPSGSSGDQS